METYIVRAWLPDRPGALGQVATHVGAVGGEIVGIDILERGGGLAVDELAVQLPVSVRVASLTAAIREVPGADVEEIRLADGGVHDPRSDALEAAAIIVGATTPSTLLDALVVHGRRLLGGTWVAVVRLDDGELLAEAGPTPSAPWLCAFLEGSRSSVHVALGDFGPDDVVWAPAPGAGLALVAGRDGSAFRARERRQVSSLARIADARLMDFVRRAHPSAPR